MKKFTALFIAFSLLCLLMVGCGQNNTAQNPTTPTNPTTPATPDKDTDNTNETKEPVTITFVRTGTPEILRNIFEPIIAKFEAENPDIKVDMQDLGWADAEKSLQTWSASKTLPDVMYHLPGTIFDLASKDLVLDLTPYLDDELKADMYPSMLEAGQYEGKQYMIACGGSTLLFWYDTAMFEKAGLDPNNPPKTWNEFLSACEKLKAAGLTPFAMYGKPSGGETSFVFESLYTTQKGAGAWDFAANQYVYDTDAEKDNAVATLKFLQDASKYAQEGFVEMGRFDARTLFKDGKAAMIFDLINMANQIPDKLETGTVKVTAIPAGASGSNSSAVNLGGWFIPKNSKNPDAAWKFLRYLMETENQLAHAQYGSVPILKSEAASYTSGYMLDVIKTVENSYAEGVNTKTPALWPATGEQLQVLFMGNQTPEQARDNIVESHKEIYNK
jgi:ABC-type glycerol-3-phosphate transport system substrate-binding protein